jgi:predicted enzyme related to lactoylglutathione lyase
MSDTEGTFIWYELSARDPKAAIRFYESVVGWHTRAFEGGVPYTIWLAGNDGIGGVAPLSNGASPSWMAYVRADDVDALTQKAQSLGARTIAEPQDIPTVGRFSVIADPQGAVLALFKPFPSDSPPLDELAPGHVRWHELLTDDWEAAFRFYSALFGWQKTDAFDMGERGTYQMYGKGGRTLGGMMNRPPGYPRAPHWLYYIHVADLDDALERVKKAGGRVWNGPMGVPGGDRVAQCADPEDALFALHGK